MVDIVPPAQPNPQQTLREMLQNGGTFTDNRGYTIKSEVSEYRSQYVLTNPAGQSFLIEGEVAARALQDLANSATNIRLAGDNVSVHTDKTLLETINTAASELGRSPASSLTMLDTFNDQRTHIRNADHSYEVIETMRDASGNTFSIDTHHKAGGMLAFFGADKGTTTATFNGQTIDPAIAEQALAAVKHQTTDVTHQTSYDHGAQTDRYEAQGTFTAQGLSKPARRGPRE